MSLSEINLLDSFSNINFRNPRWEKNTFLLKNL
jgi:hypothetical protein